MFMAGRSMAGLFKWLFIVSEARYLVVGWATVVVSTAMDARATVLAGQPLWRWGYHCWYLTCWGISRLSSSLGTPFNNSRANGGDSNSMGAGDPTTKFLGWDPLWRCLSAVGQVVAVRSTCRVNATAACSATGDGSYDLQETQHSGSNLATQRRWLVWFKRKTKKM